MPADHRAGRIYAFTKFVAALLGVVVLFAFCVLYFFPTRTKQLFAWPIAPPMTAMFMLPRGVGHQHHCEDKEDAVVIQTMTPGLDFDYLLEDLFGLGSEGRLQGIQYFVYLIVILGKMKSAFVGANLPLSFQKSVAVIVTPIFYLFGYRAVNKRFSGEEW
jgi:hypothetical protein